MAKFNKGPVKSATTSVIVTENTPSGTGHQGGPGYLRGDAKSELFLLGVANLVGEDTFYEGGGNRDTRYRELIRKVAVEDPQWVVAFLTWLRGEGNMRSAPLVGAAEFVKARLDHPTDMGVVRVGERPGFGGIYASDGLNRKVVAAVCQRADEPGELLAYWISNYGRNVPKPVKRGVADAATRLYHEYSLLKYDTASHSVRFGDVIDLTHPSPRPDAARWQGDLFAYALDRRHSREKDVPESLGMIRANTALRKQAEPQTWLDPQTLKAAGMTWEDALSAVGSKVDKAQLWAAMIPSMGYMALLRNLRNFEQAGVSDAVLNGVAARLADAEQVKRSRQFPFRFLAAHQATGASLRWGWPLEQALNASLANVPALDGCTLILVDRSGSMWGPVSEKSGLNNADTAALFGTALALRARKATLVQYDGAWSEISLVKGASVLKTLEQFGGGGGTNTVGAVQANFVPGTHTRVVVLTDEQPGVFGGYYGVGYRMSANADVFAPVPPHVPCYTWNLVGYQKGHAPSGGKNRHTFGGLTDASFRTITLLEAGRNGTWPWENTAD